MYNDFILWTFGKNYELSNIRIKKLQLQIEIKGLELKENQALFEIKKINQPANNENEINAEYESESDAEYESESDAEYESESIHKILLFEKQIEYEKSKQELIKTQIEYEKSKQIEYERIKQELIKTQIECEKSKQELNEIELKKNEVDLKIKKIEENNKNKESEKKEEEKEKKEISKEEPQLFTIRKRNHSSRIPKIYQYNPDNLTTPIKMYNGPSDVERQNESFSPSPLKLASKNNTIYKGFRWLYVNRNEEPPQELEPTKETKNVSPDVQFIAMIDIKKTKILAVYSNQKQAVEARNMKCNSFSRAIQQQSLSSGHYWNFFDKCSQEMKTEYLSHSKLPEKYLPSCSKKVQQIDPKTNEVIKTYNSNRDVCKTAQISTATIRRITETGEIYNGYKWKIAN